MSSIRALVFTLVWIQTVIGAGFLMGQSGMEIFELPISSTEFEKLQLPQTARDGMVGMYTTEKVSKRVCHSVRDSGGKLKEISWFAALIDDGFTITRIAKKSGECYWVLNPKTGSTSEYVCVPISGKCPSKVESDLAYGSSMQMVIALMRCSFDHFDVSRQPFRIAGLPASEYADFLEQLGSKAREEWKSSRLVFTSIGGDALLVSGSNAAWYQLETNSVLPCGTFEQAIQRYFKSVASDREFSSWTDVKSQ